MDSNMYFLKWVMKNSTHINHKMSTNMPTSR